MQVVFIGNKFVPLERAAISVTDMVIWRGYGVTEVLRTYGGQPFALAEHLQRLSRSLGLLEIPQLYSDRFIERIIREGLKRFGGGREILIKILVSGGPGYQIMPDGKPELILLFTVLKRPPESDYRRGLRLVSKKFFPILPGAKTTNYLAAVLGHKQAKRQGYDEPLFMDGKKNII